MNPKVKMRSEIEEKLRRKYEEKLIELIHKAFQPCEMYRAMIIADHLIANGVTIPVRCKDCVSYQETMGKDSGKPCGYGSCFNPCAIITGIVYDEDFCSYGERRTNA